MQGATIVDDPRMAMTIKMNQMTLVRSTGRVGVLCNDQDLQLLTCGKDQHECRRITNTAIRLPTSTLTDTHSSFHGSSFWFHQVDVDQYLGVQSAQEDTFIVTDTLDSTSSIIAPYSMWGMFKVMMEKTTWFLSVIYRCDYGKRIKIHPWKAVFCYIITCHSTTITCIPTHINMH